MAIKIRGLEMQHNAMGAVGSSPYVPPSCSSVKPLKKGLLRTVVIIFAPLTLVHVMAAVYV